MMIISESMRGNRAQWGLGMRLELRSCVHMYSSMPIVQYVTLLSQPRRTIRLQAITMQVKVLVISKRELYIQQINVITENRVIRRINSNTSSVWTSDQIPITRARLIRSTGVQIKYVDHKKFNPLTTKLTLMQIGDFGMARDIERE